MLWYKLNKKLVIGSKKIKLAYFDGKPINSTMGFLKNNKTNIINTLKRKLIIKVKAKMFAASLFAFGSTIVASYLSAEIMVTMLKILKKTAIAPKSSGLYIRLKNGCNNSGIA